MNVKNIGANIPSIEDLAKDIPSIDELTEDIPSLSELRKSAGLDSDPSEATAGHFKLSRPFDIVH